MGFLGRAGFVILGAEKEPEEKDGRCGTNRGRWGGGEMRRGLDCNVKGLLVGEEPRGDTSHCPLRRGRRKAGHRSQPPPMASVFPGTIVKVTAKRRARRSGVRAERGRV